MTTEQMRPVLDDLVAKGLVRRTVRGRDAMYFVPKQPDSMAPECRREVRAFTALKGYDAMMKSAMIRR